MEKENIRLKELAILKAQNEMLEQAKNNIISMNRGDDGNRVIREIVEAQNDNIKMGSSYYGASKNEINSASYSEPNQYEIDRYNKRLEAKGLTQSELEQKDLTRSSGVNISVSSDTQEQTKKPKRRKPKRIKGVGYVEENNKPKDNENLEVIYTKEVGSVESEEKTNSRPLYDIPDYVQYDIIPLPSKGECYTHKKSRIPVAYLTASDENLIASPNMYRDGKLIDTILDRKILDKDVNPKDLCKGDRDAIILWLRATGYGSDFPITVRNPKDETKKYHTSIDLSKLKYLDFKIEGDEDGNFTYQCKNGDIIKFRFLTYENEENFRNRITEQISNSDTSVINKHLSELKYYIQKDTDIEEDDKNVFLDNIKDMREYFNDNEEDTERTEVYANTVTERMIIHTVSINGNTDREFVKRYIENMRSGEAFSYRNYILKNTPGVDFTIKISIPESDGGGSFDTFLRLDDAIFLNV